MTSIETLESRVKNIVVSLSKTQENSNKKIMEVTEHFLTRIKDRDEILTLRFKGDVKDMLGKKYEEWDKKIDTKMDKFFKDRKENVNVRLEFYRFLLVGALFLLSMIFNGGGKLVDLLSLLG